MTRERANLFILIIITVFTEVLRWFHAPFNESSFNTLSTQETGVFKEMPRQLTHTGTQELHKNTTPRKDPFKEKHAKRNPATRRRSQRAL